MSSKYSEIVPDEIKEIIRDHFEFHGNEIKEIVKTIWVKSYSDEDVRFPYYLVRLMNGQSVVCTDEEDFNGKKYIDEAYVLDTDDEKEDLYCIENNIEDGYYVPSDEEELKQMERDSWL